MIPQFWRGPFTPRDPLSEPRPRAAFTNAPPDTDLPLQQSAQQAERDRDAVQRALSQLDSRRTRWEL